MKSQINLAEKRLRILGDDEIKALYGRPRFTDEERDRCFVLSQNERELLQEFRSVRSHTLLILQLGYLKANLLFFTFDLHVVEEDVQFVLKRNFPHGQFDLRPATGISPIKSGQRSAGSNIQAGTRTYSSSPFAKSTPTSSSSSADSVLTNAKTRPGALFGNMPTFSAACICWTSLIRRLCVAISSGR